MKKLFIGTLFILSSLSFAGDSVCTDSHGVQMKLSIADKSADCEDVLYGSLVCPATLTIGENSIEGLGFEGDGALSFVSLTNNTELVWDADTKEGTISSGNSHSDDITCF